jgi:hypothetical protein
LVIYFGNGQGAMPIRIGASSGRSQQDGRSNLAVHRQFDSTRLLPAWDDIPGSVRNSGIVESGDVPADDGLPSPEARHIEMKL